MTKFNKNNKIINNIFSKPSKIIKKSHSTQRTKINFEQQTITTIIFNNHDKIVLNTELSSESTLSGHSSEDQEENIC
ncbi:MAG: hypothetical protein H6909_00580 [Rickettsiaceae bacterium]|nr:hypothetical protein [Rickettsiaceae bacterium]